MKFRNKWKRYNKFLSIGEEGGGEAGGNEGTGGTGGNEGGDNNADANLLSNDTLWQPNEDNSDGGGNQNDSGGGQQQQGPNANEQFQAHIDSLDFHGGIDLAAGMASIQAGDTEAFGKMLSMVGQNAYRNAMVDSNKIVQQNVEKMGKQVQSDVSASQSTGELVREMGSQLPFTKSPAYAPVAKLVLTQFLQKGATPEKAIESVGKYFQQMSGEVAKLNPGAPGGRPSGGFGGNSNQGDGNTSEDTDWINILGGPAQ